MYEISGDEIDYLHVQLTTDGGMVEAEKYYGFIREKAMENGNISVIIDDVMYDLWFVSGQRVRIVDFVEIQGVPCCLL